MEELKIEERHDFVLEPIQQVERKSGTLEERTNDELLVKDWTKVEELEVGQLLAKVWNILELCELCLAREVNGGRRQAIEELSTAKYRLKIEKVSGVDWEGYEFWMVELTTEVSPGVSAKRLKVPVSKLAKTVEFWGKCLNRD